MPVEDDTTLEDCDEETKARAEARCMFMADAEGPFADCHNIVRSNIPFGYHYVLTKENPSLSVTSVVIVQS